MAVPDEPHDESEEYEDNRSEYDRKYIWRHSSRFPESKTVKKMIRFVLTYLGYRIDEDVADVVGLVRCWR